MMIGRLRRHPSFEALVGSPDIGKTSPQTADDWWERGSTEPERAPISGCSVAAAWHQLHGARMSFLMAAISTPSTSGATLEAEGLVSYPPSS